jgi:hypothetical protein
MSISQQLTQSDMFARDAAGNWITGAFIGRPYRLSYSRAEVLVADAWKARAKGVPQGCFLLAYFDNDLSQQTATEAVLLRVLQPTRLPTDQAVISSMVEYYKDNIRTGDTARSQLDTYTRYEFSFSGVECSVLGSFYRSAGGDRIVFGADLENFFSAHNYSVIKPSADILRLIVNYREHGSPGDSGDIKIGRVRYSSSRRHQAEDDPVTVYARAQDFAGKRTALFGMTRTGKSNTVKKIIQACVEMSKRAPLKLDKDRERPDEVLKPFTDEGSPKYPLGQIVFDINGEYANPNLQDAGTAIFDLFKEITVRYATAQRPGFREMKVNFYEEIDNGFDLIKSHPQIATDSSRFVSNFRAVDLTPPDEKSGSAAVRHDRRRAVYQCILYRAGFAPPEGLKVKFQVNAEVKRAVDARVAPEKGLTLEKAAAWWDRFWEVYDADEDGIFQAYKQAKDHEWADDDLKNLLVMMTRRRKSGGGVDCSGFRTLLALKDQHTATIQKPFDEDIVELLRAGKIVIVDLSLGDPSLQRMFSERICHRIFSDALQRFVRAVPNNFIQFYFEEAHNLFPKKDDPDLSQIYNRLAKEGAKLNLGLAYATQEVSSISGNILKATQNWFISHLNNEDEIKELRKYYDFSDFTDGLIRFAENSDKGFIRMKTYSNPFVIPCQIDRFAPEPKAKGQ